MKPVFSDLGAKLGGPCGIQELMDDLGQALSTHPNMRMLGGGNPAAIPEMQALWRDQWRALVDEEPDRLDRALVNYDPPAGNTRFREVMAAFLQRECGWSCEAKNIAVLPGGQAAFFYLQMLLVGGSGGRQMLYPIAPDYIGYANQGLHAESLASVPGQIEQRGAHRFKYHIDFERLRARLSPQTAGLCLSCPTNPTGNVVSAEELDQLRELAREQRVPLILDQAYGMPFPGAIYVDWKPVWDEGIIASISLSKLGLPGLRTSVIVADESVVTALANMNSVVALANGNIGQALLQPLLEDATLTRCAREVIRPFYQRRRDFAEAVLSEALGDAVPYALHESQGAFFLWLWLRDCPVTSAELYRRLKEREVLVVPGHYFFFGLEEAWQHQHECLRITYSQPEAVVREGLQILAEEVRKAYAEG
ncbi:MAG: valine--pyruvate transaminase [Verrucomicrobiales bacterium]|nr:valine--pyruvate transaminase [Verrucomicrobiales bacterium]